MNQGRLNIVLLLSLAIAGTVLSGGGCVDKPKPYGTERSLNWMGAKRQIWAIAPAINISGQTNVDPLLQADLLYEQLQRVNGITVIPVNRVAEVFASLNIEKVQSADQATVVCDLLGCDGLVVPTVTAFDPYNPPKFGVSLQLFTPPSTFARPASLDVRDLVRRGSPGPNESVPQGADFVQAVGMYDAANGSVRQALFEYAAGRNDPNGPLGSKEYLVNMDRYCGFVYNELIAQLITSAAAR